MDLKGCNLQGGLKEGRSHGGVELPDDNFIYVHMYVKVKGVWGKYIDVIKPVYDIVAARRYCEKFMLKCKALQVKE